jgi:hypothetical protein
MERWVSFSLTIALLSIHLLRIYELLYLSFVRLVVAAMIIEDALFLNFNGLINYFLSALASESAGEFSDSKNDDNTFKYNFHANSSEMNGSISIKLIWE